MADSTTSGEVIRFGTFELDVSSGELRKRGVRLPIQGLPLQILAILAAKRGSIVTREELRNRLWPADTFVDFDHSIRNAIARLREALDESAESPRYIETLPRRGYRFIGQVESSPSANVTPAQPAATMQAAAVQPTAVVQPIAVARRSSKMVIALITLAAVVGLGVVAYLRVWPRSQAAPIRSVAVLPLKNLSGDPTQDYLADGMTEALISRLSRIHDLRVISRTSVMSLKDSKLSVPEIAKTLQVDALVEGSVIRDGSRIRVHAQLIRAATDEHFWSEEYDRELRDALALESEVAQAIARKVEVTVTGHEREWLTAAREVSPEVYESYLKGWYTLGKSHSRTGVEDSVGYFEDAIRRDPTFAPAYVGLATAYNNLGTVFMGAYPEEMRAKVIGAAQKALEIDPESAEAHLLLAEMQQKQWQWAEAEAGNRRVLELNPNNAAAHMAIARWMLCQGRTEEAVKRAQRARALDPLAISGHSMGWVLFQARRYDEAIRELRSALVVEPSNVWALWFLGFALIANNQSDEAIPVLEKTLAISDRSPAVMGVLVNAYAHAGRRPDALRLLDEMKSRRHKGYVPPAAFVNAYLGLGENDEAFYWFEQAYKEHSNILQSVKVHPFMDPVRDDPRFKEIVRRVGLDRTY
jgi:pentatricopeptide repeat protein